MDFPIQEMMQYCLLFAETLEKKGPSYEARILSNMPEKTKRDYGFEAINRRNIVHLLKEIKKAEVLLMGGGSLLQDVTSSRSLYYYLSLLVIARMFGTKTILYANGIGPIKKSHNRLLAKMIMNKVSVITLRERLSEKELVRLKVDQPKIHITSDPVFNLEVPKIDTARILAKEGIKSDNGLVAIFFQVLGGS